MRRKRRVIPTLQEPEARPEMTEQEIGAALTWYSLNKTLDNARKYLEDALEPERHKRMSRVPREWIPRTAAWIYRLQSRGALISERMLRNADKWIEEAFEHERKDVSPRTPRDITSELIGELEGMIDDETVVDIYEWLESGEVTISIANKILEKFSRQVEGLEEDLTLNDFEDSEKVSTTQILQMVRNIVEDTQKYITDKKTPRKTRKKKVVSPEKKVEKFRYLSKNEDIGIVSLPPRELVGAKTAWIYDVRKRKLAVYKGILDVKGVRLIGYEQASFLKLPRNEEKRNQVLRSISRKKQVFKELSGIPSGISTEDNIILRVEK